MSYLLSLCYNFPIFSTFCIYCALLGFIPKCYGYFQNVEKGQLNTKSNHVTLIKNLKLNFDYETSSTFPNVFNASFTELNQSFHVRFIRYADKQSSSHDIYIIDPITRNPVIYNEFDLNQEVRVLAICIVLFKMKVKFFKLIDL